MSEDQKKQLEQQLWNIANTLRGKMDADEFRDYILGFIFYKYLSEKMHSYADKLLKEDGIKYTDADPLVFEGKSYPGIKISYEAGVGESPDDEYVMYYDSETNKMTWLAYTVTYFSKAKSEKWSFIHYSDWQEVEGLLMPKTLSWYNVENNLPTTKRNDVEFSHVMMTTDKMSLKMYMMPDDAEVVQ